MMMRLALAAALLPAAAAAPTCTAAQCCMAKVTGMCGYNTHDLEGDLMGAVDANGASIYTSTDTTCPSDSALIAAAATTAKPATAATGAAAAEAVCCACDVDYKVVSNACVGCASGKFIASGVLSSTDTTCADVSKCSTYTCAAGSKLKTTAAATACDDTVPGTGVCTATANEGTCCEANVCIKPAADPAGYDVTSTDGDGTVTVTAAANAFESADGGCATGFAGTAVAACATDGGAFTYSGCVADALCSTGTLPSGYTAKSDATLKCAGACDFTTGDLATCADANVCIKPAADPAGYDVTTTDGDGTVTVTAAANAFASADGGCATGFTGTAVAACATGGGAFTYSGCVANALCSTGTLPASYTAKSDATLKCAGACDFTTGGDLATCADENTCTAMTETAIKALGYDTDVFTATTVTGLNSVTGEVRCAAGYELAATGTAASVTCATTFTFAGCTARVGYCTDMPDTEDEDALLDTYACGDDQAVDNFNLEALVCSPDSVTDPVTTCTMAAFTDYELLTLVTGTKQTSDYDSKCTKTAGTATCAVDGAGVAEQKCDEPAAETKTAGAAAAAPLAAVAALVAALA